VECDVVLRLLSAASCIQFIKQGNRRRGTELSRLYNFALSDGSVKSDVSLNGIELDEYCRALGDHSRMSLDIRIIACALSHWSMCVGGFLDAIEDQPNSCVILTIFFSLGGLHR
jgi:hypothetical protein